MHCPLCLSTTEFENWPHLAWKEPRFFQCFECASVFVAPQTLATPEKEKARYETHNNDLAARGFANFLMKTVDEIAQHFPKGARILDFGSGPDPSMSTLLRNAGFDVTSYDPFFAPGEPTGLFDLVLAHEVFEHLRDPRIEIQKIRGWLKPSGTFLIRSELCPDRETFANWWYARDFTHIFFCSTQTLAWIKQNENWSLRIWSPVLWAFRAPDAVGPERDR